MHYVMTMVLALSACASKPRDDFNNYLSQKQVAGTFCRDYQYRYPNISPDWQAGCEIGYLRQCSPGYCPKEER